MANGTLPNPSFGNDPATLLGSLIVEIGELQKDQQNTTKRIENLDENEDRSTSLIEDAIRDDIKEGIKRTDTLKDLTRGTLKHQNAVKIASEEDRNRAKEDHESRMASFEAIKKVREDMSFMDKRSFFAEKAMMEIGNFFDTSNEQGIKKVFGDVVDGIGNAFTRGASSGTEQVKRGFENLTDGMGALGPVVNAFKTGLSKAGAVVDVAVGSFRAVGQAFSATKGAIGNFFELSAPKNEFEEAVDSGDIVVKDDPDELGSVKNPMFFEFTDSALDALQNVLGGGSQSQSIPSDMEKTSGGLLVPKGSKREKMEEKKFRKESLKNINEQRRYRRGTPRAFLYLGGIIMILAVLLNSIKSFIENPGSFFKGNESAFLGSIAGLVNFSTNAKPSNPLDEMDVDKIKSARATSPGSGVAKGRPRSIGAIKNLSQGFQFSPFSAFGAEDLKPLARSPFKVSGSGMLPNFANKASSFVFSGPTGMVNAINPYAQKQVSSQIMVNGKLTSFGKSLTPMERLKLGGISFFRSLPAAFVALDIKLTKDDYDAAKQVLDDLYYSGVALRLGDSGEERPMTKPEYDFLNAQLTARMTGEAIGGSAAIIGGAAAGTALIAAFTPTPDVAVAGAAGGPLAPVTAGLYYLTKAGAVMAASGFVAYGIDAVASDAATGIVTPLIAGEQGDNRFNLSTLDQVRIIEPIDTASSIEGVVDEIRVVEGEIQGVSIGAPVVVDSSDNSSNTAFVDQRPPADDEGLRESEKERSSYFNTRH